MAENESHSDCQSEKDSEPKKWKWSNIYERPEPTIALLMVVIAIFLTLVIGTIIFQVQGVRNLKKDFNEEINKSQKRLEDFVKMEEDKFHKSIGVIIASNYSRTIDMYISKLRDDDPNKNTTAIWALLNILKEAKELSRDYPGLFDKVVCEYSQIIPYMPLDIDKNEFRDSYRGKVRTWVMLLESKQDCIRNVIRQEIRKTPRLTEKLIDEIYEYNKEKVYPEPGNVEDFKDSIERLKPHISSVK